MTVGQKIDGVLTNAKSIVIMSHTAPDSDAICSCLALADWIKRLFNKKRIDFAIDGKIPATFKPIIQKTKFTPTWFKYDVAICLDCATTKRLGKYEKIFNRSAHKINIDHHESNSEFGDIVKVEKESSSTCEIIYRMYKNREVKMTDRVAKLIYAGIVTDTACFTTNNITQNTHKIVAELVKMDINVDEIKNYFFKNNSKAKIYLLEKALKSLKYYHDNKIVLMKISYNDLNKTETTFEDTVGLVDYALNISCVDIAIAVIEKKPKQFYISLRSKNSNVADVARIMGGGGHSSMAAFQHKGDIRLIQQKLINECKKVCGEISDFEKIFD